MNIGNQCVEHAKQALDGTEKIGNFPVYRTDRPCWLENRSIISRWPNLFKVRQLYYVLESVLSRR